MGEYSQGFNGGQEAPVDIFCPPGILAVYFLNQALCSLQKTDFYVVSCLSPMRYNLKGGENVKSHIIV